MFKQGVICVCDSCGSQEVAQEISGPYGESEKDYIIPEVWATGINPEVHFCPDYAKKLKGEGYYDQL